MKIALEDCRHTTEDAEVDETYHDEHRGETYVITRFICPNCTKLFERGRPVDEHSRSGTIEIDF